MKTLILIVIEWALYRMCEHTPPETKHSEINLRVARAAIAVGELRELLNELSKPTSEAQIGGEEK